MELKLNTNLMLMKKRSGSWEILKAIEGMSLLFHMILRRSVNLLLKKLRKILSMEIFGSFNFNYN